MQCESLLRGISNEEQGSWYIYLPPTSHCLRAEQVPVPQEKSQVPAVVSYQNGVHRNGKCQGEISRALTATRTPRPQPNPFLKRKGVSGD